VSFQYSISFYGHRPDKSTQAGCPTVEAFATTAVTSREAQVEPLVEQILEQSF